MKLSILILLILLFGSTLCAEPLSEKEQLSARGLLNALGCRACHDFEQSGSNLAGSLDRIGLKLDEKTIFERLQRPPEKLGQDAKFMPSYRATPKEKLKLLSRFLAERK